MKLTRLYSLHVFEHSENVCTTVALEKRCTQPSTKEVLTVAWLLFWKLLHFPRLLRGPDASSHA